MTALAHATPTMAFDEAKELTAQIRTAVEDLARLVCRAHDERAWAALGYPSFVEYVRQEFQMSKSKAYRMLDYGNLEAVVSQIGKTGPVIESQIRPLLELEAPAERAEAWQEAVDATNGKPRAKDVEAVVKRRKARNETVVDVEAESEPLEPPPHATGEISDAELDAQDKGNPPCRVKLAFRECSEREQLLAGGFQSDEMKGNNLVLITALFLSCMSDPQLVELGKRVDFALLLETSRIKS